MVGGGERQVERQVPGTDLVMQKAPLGVVPVMLLVLLGSSARGQEQKRDLPHELGWDLSYAAVLKKNGVGPDDYLEDWLKGTDRAFPRKILATWRGGPIQQSVLVEFPHFHAGEHVLLWFIRTKDQAFFWRGEDKGDKKPRKMEISAKLFDEAFTSMWSWKQAQRPNPKHQKPDEVPGYLGVLNMYNGKGSRQILLTQGDLWVGDEAGRLGKLLQPFLK
jgi:hypothetical protein